MKKKFIIAIACAGIVGVILLKLASNKKKINEKNQPVKTENILIPVTIDTAREVIQQAGIMKTGMLAPFREAKVLSVSSGSIRRLLFSLGDNVREGQTLAVIDTRLLELDLEKSASNVSKLRRDLETYTELQAGNAATQEKVNEIRQNYVDATNESEQLKKQIADAGIKAPTSGVIGAKSVEEGMFITAGGDIATIVNLSRLKVQVNLTESEVYQVTQGQKIKLTTDVYPDRSFFGTVTFISPQASQTHNYQVEITADNDKDTPLRSGTFVYADFSKSTAMKILLIPRSALNESKQDASVYVVKEGKAVLRKIKVGDEYGDNIHVISGLQTGEQVVTSGQINLKEGTFINVSK
ncbi:efflux RND transporter periplasmic adaptor subunit [Chitinophaga sp. RAB17]|uniref:efflux RND transporter periplasmic adaptor subunit n=1 Tax=Chitinophaga sp. RAB17 TaxID=3233049 RepID=UPI003F8F2A8B